jgi:hypothetical protein
MITPNYPLDIDNIFDNVNECNFHETDTPSSYTVISYKPT